MSDSRKRGVEETELQNECVFCIWGGDFGGASGFRSFANGFVNGENDATHAKNNTCAREKPRVEKYAQVE